MSDITVTISPTFDRVAKAYRRAGKDIEETMRNFISEYAALIDRYAKQVTPVDTGRLRSSISAEFPIADKGKTAMIGTHNVRYAKFVHDGTRKMRGRPFMKYGSEFAAQKFNDRSFNSRLDKKLRESLSQL